MNELIKLGHSITHDWTSFENEGDSKSRMSQSAVNDINGVKSCDVLIAFLTDPKYAYRGSFSECGCALGLNKQTIIVNADELSYCTTNVFYHHPSILHVKSWDELLLQLENIQLVDKYSINLY